MFQHKFISLGILTLCLIVFCETRYVCCPPERWEGSFRGTYTKTSSKGSLDTMVGNVNFSYDATLQRIAMRGIYSDLKGNFLFNQSLVMDYKTGVQYDFAATPCSATVKGKVNGSCVSEDAPVLSHSQVRFGEEVMETTTYWVNSTGVFPQKVTLIDKSCIALSIELEQVNGYWTLLYRNVKHGIRDPNVFNIPASCWNSTMNNPVIERRFVHF